MGEIFSEIRDAAKSIQKSWMESMEFFQTVESQNGEKFNLEAEIPGTDKALWWFDERILSVGNLLASLEEKELDAGAPLPELFVSELNAAVDGLKTQVDKLTNHARQVTDNQLTSLTPTNWVVNLASGNQQINFASFLQNLVSPIETSLVKYYAVSGIIQSKEFDAFAIAVREFSEKAEDVRKNTKTVKTARSKSEALLSEIDDLKQASELDRKAISELVTDIKKTASEVEEFHAQSTANVQEIEAIKSAADALKMEIEGYSGDFDLFQKNS